ncbi:MAG: hypothetical protein ACREQ5_06170 [Candidatus Dormibacteria bacterium]
MNTRDIAETKAAEMLRELNIPHTVGGLNVLMIATNSFLQGWVYGLQDAQKVHADVFGSTRTIAPTDSIRYHPD